MFLNWFRKVNLSAASRRFGTNGYEIWSKFSKFISPPMI